MIKIAPGTVFRNIQAQTVLAVHIAETVFDWSNCPLEILSACDGQHKVTSKHYAGLAMDFALPSKYNHTETSLDEAVFRRLRDALGDQFGLKLEATHIHIEFDPRGE